MRQDKNGSWWFHDEEDSDEAGPFHSREAAEKAAAAYAKLLEDGDVEACYASWPRGAEWESVRRTRGGP